MHIVSAVCSPEPPCRCVYLSQSSKWSAGSGSALGPGTSIKQWHGTTQRQHWHKVRKLYNVNCIPFWAAQSWPARPRRRTPVAGCSNINQRKAAAEPGLASIITPSESISAAWARVRGAGRHEPVQSATREPPLLRGANPAQDLRRDHRGGQSQHGQAGSLRLPSHQVTREH